MGRRSKVKIVKQGADLQKVLNESMSKMDPGIVRNKLPRLRKACAAALRVIKLGVDTFSSTECVPVSELLNKEFVRSKITVSQENMLPKEWYKIWFDEMFKRYSLSDNNFTAEDSIQYYLDLVEQVGRPCIFSMSKFAQFKQFYHEEDPLKPSIKWAWMVKRNFANKKIMIWFDLVDVCSTIRTLNANNEMRKVSNLMQTITRLSGICKNIRSIVVEEPNVDVDKIVDSLSSALDQLEKQIKDCGAAFRTIRNFLPEFRNNFNVYNEKIAESGGNAGTALEMILSDASKNVDNASTSRQFNKIIHTLTSRFNSAVSNARMKDLPQQQLKNIDRASKMAQLVDDIVTGLDGEDSDDEDSCDEDSDNNDEDHDDLD